MTDSPETILGLLVFFAVMTVACIVWEYALRRREVRRREVLRAHIMKVQPPRRWSGDPKHERTVYEQFYRDRR